MLLWGSTCHVQMPWDSASLVRVKSVVGLLSASGSAPLHGAAPLLLLPGTHTSLLHPDLSKETSIAIIHLERENWSKTLHQIRPWDQLYFLILQMDLSLHLSSSLPLVPKCISDFGQVFIREPFISRSTGFPSGFIYGAYLRPRILQSVGTIPGNHWSPVQDSCLQIFQITERTGCKIIFWAFYQVTPIERLSFLHCP